MSSAAISESASTLPAAGVPCLGCAPDGCPSANASLTFPLFGRKKGFDIKWVDDTHALGIFSSPITGTAPGSAGDGQRGGIRLLQPDPGLRADFARGHAALFLQHAMPSAPST